jgi:hypothetical protein
MPVTRSAALALMIECEGHDGKTYGKMLPAACASRYRVASGKQDGPESVRQSACKGCPNGEERDRRLGDGKGQAQNVDDVGDDTESVDDVAGVPAAAPAPAARTLRMPVPNFVREAAERSEQDILKCEECLREFPRNKVGPPRRFCQKCRPSLKIAPLPESAICRNQQCGKSFAPETHGQVFCTPQCQKAAENRRRDVRERIRDAEEEQRRTAGAGPVTADEERVAAAVERRFGRTNRQEPLGEQRRQCGCGRWFSPTSGNQQRCEVCLKPVDERSVFELLHPTADASARAHEARQELERRKGGEAAPESPAPAEWKPCGNPKCGRMFELTYPTRRYCSGRCSRTAEHDRRRARERLEAGSTSATESAPVDATERRCALEECGKDISHRHGRAKYCSDKCGMRGAYLNRLAAEGRRPEPEDETEGQESDMAKKTFGTATCAFDECGVTFTKTSPRHEFHKPECKVAAKRKAKDTNGGGRTVRRAKASAEVAPRRTTSRDVTPGDAPRFRVSINGLDIECRDADDVIMLAQRFAARAG